MTPQTPPEPAYGVGPEHDSRLDYVAVQRAAIGLLVAGVRPTVANLREKLGSGSATTLHQLLGQFWAEIGKDLAGETAVAMRLPPHVARAAELLWFAALEDAENRLAVSKHKREEGLLESERRQQVREHAISLRERELELQLLARDQLIGQLQKHIKTQLTMAECDRQTIESQQRRIETQRKSLATVEQRLAQLAPLRQAQVANARKAAKRVIAVRGFAPAAPKGRGKTDSPLTRPRRRPVRGRR